MLPVSDLEYILSSASGTWESFREKSVLITGGTGFFGKWLLESFLFANRKLHLNARMTVLSRDPGAFLNEFPAFSAYAELTFIRGSVTDFVFPEGELDYIIHAATESYVRSGSEDQLETADTIVNGTKRVLDLAVQKQVRSFLFVSSGAVYGRQPASVSHVSEADCFPIDINSPDSAYTEGKRLGEVYCAIYHRRFSLPVRIARCFAFVGPYMALDKHFAIGNFINDVLKGRDIVITGDGRTVRSYQYAADLAAWLWMILVNGAENQPYNVGSEEALPLKEFAGMAASSDPRVQVRILTPVDETAAVGVYAPSTRKVRDALNIRTQISAADAIGRTMSFYKSIQVKS